MPYTFGPLIWGIVCALGVRISGRLSPNANRHGNPTTAMTIAETRATQPTTRDMDSPTFTTEFQLHEDSEHCESLRTPCATDNTSAPGFRLSAGNWRCIPVRHRHINLPKQAHDPLRSMLLPSCHPKAPSFQFLSSHLVQKVPGTPTSSVPGIWTAICASSAGGTTGAACRPQSSKWHWPVWSADHRYHTRPWSRSKLDPCNSRAISPSCRPSAAPRSSRSPRTAIKASTATSVAESRRTYSPLQSYRSSPHLINSFNMRDRDDHSTE